MNTWKELIEFWKSSEMPFHEVILTAEMLETGDDPEIIKKELLNLLSIMMEEAEKQFGKKQETLTNLTGNNAYKLANTSPTYFGRFNYIATTTALSISESNAAMGKIVACPTAGASGIIPGIFYALKKEFKEKTEKLLPAFIVSGGVGNIIAKKATISGAAGGCQAEIGTATAMAAAGLVYYVSRDGVKAGHAASLALKSLMGLVCDPVGGFVEVPCVKRNGNAVNVAISSAEMALANIESKIPLDEVVDAMRIVGKSLPESLRETGEGGIAATPTARRLIESIRHFSN
ncbi:L-serine ammonia-lyase, iron-sulfur-dependent, subunit alpha [Thermosipho ferrireducens]|uniref:L-serine dehydratase n=1 Tax=Thermosipho ferrireducens TaxID=2571116 RepID=A0ABX7S732_9BACT|nr:L-serine ammonia-lyase, iron-sulfur-dependent, subunit alpha [Thermosipho ferrireducens]QTA37718.1 L-serine ammonia-lyase, iron-sulfur-dependent, subunit alpha [Thermosipho ferrireducens]